MSAKSTIQQAYIPIKNCQVNNYEIYFTKMYCEARRPEKLGLSLAIASNIVLRIKDEDYGKERLGNLNIKNKLVLITNLAMDMRNPVMHKCAFISQAIADIRLVVQQIFSKYLDFKGFNQLEPLCLLGAASKDSANMFKLSYFGKDTFLI